MDHELSRTIALTIKAVVDSEMRRSLDSICIPSYNYARYLPKAIDSALAQTYEKIEVIIVDDGSTDDSLELAKIYQRKYPSVVKVFQHEGGANRGVSATINAGLLQSSGVYWCVMGADDELLPHKTTQQVELLENNPELILAYGRAIVVDRDSNALGVSIGNDVTHHADPFELLLYGDAIPASTIMARKDRLEVMGLWHDENLVNSDWELWLRLIAHFRFGFIDEPLVLYRDHGENMSINHDLPIKFERLNDPRMQALIDLNRTFYLFGLERFEEASTALNDAFRTDCNLQTDVRCLARWLNGRRPDFTSFVLRTLIKRDLVPASSWISPRLSYVLSKAFIKFLIGPRMTEGVARAKRRTLSLMMYAPSWRKRGWPRSIANAQARLSTNLDS